MNEVLNAYYFFAEPAASVIKITEYIAFLSYIYFSEELPISTFQRTDEEPRIPRVTQVYRVQLLEDVSLHVGRLLADLLDADDVSLVATDLDGLGAVEVVPGQELVPRGVGLRQEVAAFVPAALAEAHDGRRAVGNLKRNVGRKIKHHVSKL